MANGINTAHDLRRRAPTPDQYDSAYANKAMSLVTYRRNEGNRPMTAAALGASGRASMTRTNPFRSTPERRLTEPKPTDRGEMQRIRRPRNG